MIEITNASFTYEGETEKSLNEVSLQVKKGECVLITGPSGCGKSTLLRLVNGLIPHYYPGRLSGEIRVAGTVPGSVPLYSRAGEVSTVLQNPKAQFYTTDTISEIAFTLENQGMPEEEILDRIERTAEAMHIESLMGRSMFALSGGEKQKIACACAAAAGTDLILMDEPTANLDYEASLQLGEIIRRWKEEGKTILIAEHRIAWILETVTRLLIMEEGIITSDAAMPAGAPSGNGTEGEIRQHKADAPEGVNPVPPFRTGRPIRAAVPENPSGIDLPEWGGDNLANPESGFEIRNLCFSYDGKHRVLDYDRIPIARGAVTAIVGRNGRGKTTFLRCFSGLEKKDRSILVLHGERLDAAARRKKVYLIAQDVNFQIFTQEVREEMEISLPADIRKDPERSEKRIREIAEELDLIPFLDRDPSTLSGGQKQRTAVACAIASEREILLFDEPTSGLDRFHMQEVADLLRKSAADGKTILVVTHDSELICACADYRLVL